MYADGLKQALRAKIYGNGVGMGTGVMGMRWGLGETCGDGMGKENKTSCPRAALYSAL